MNLFMSLYLAALFVALTPGVLLTLPKGGSKMKVAVVHGLVFAVVWHFTHKMVWSATAGFEGLRVMGAQQTQQQRDATLAAALAAQQAAQQRDATLAAAMK